MTKHASWWCLYQRFICAPSATVVSDSEKPRPSSRTKSRFARQPSPRTSRSVSVMSSRDRTSIVRRLLRCSAVTLARGYPWSQMAIYLDHAATSPLRPQVLEAMLPYLREHSGNPSSLHGSGRRARQGIDEAREVIAGAINAQPREIVFTGSGTEADNLAIKGIAWAESPRGR